MKLQDGNIELETGDTITVNGIEWTMNADGTMSGTGLDISELGGPLTGGDRVTKMHGPGLSVVGGEMVVTAEIADNVTGLSNPLLEHINADGYDINNIGHAGAGTVSVNNGLDAGSVTTDELTNDTGLTDSQTELSAQTPIVENWERQTTAYYDVSDSSPDFVSSPVLDGSVAIQNTSNPVQLISPFEMKRGFVYRLHGHFAGNAGNGGLLYDLFMITSGSDITSDADGYRFLSDKRNDEVEIGRVDSGTFSSLAISSGTIPTGEYSILEVEFGYKGMIARVLDIDGTQIAATSRTTDTNYTSGKLGIFISDTDDSDTITVDQITRRPL